MKRFLTTLALALALVSLPRVDAEAGLDKKLGIAGYEWLKVGQSARATGMGEAYTAVAEGVDGAFVNPAAMTAIKRFEYGFNYTAWLVDTKLYSAAAGFKAGNSVWGMSVLTYSPPASKETTVLQPKGTGNKVEASGVAVGGLFAYQFTDKLSFGMQVRYLQEKLFTDKNKTMDINVGTKFHTGFRGMRLAMNLKNLGKDFKYGQALSSNFMPMVFNVGLAVEVAGKPGDRAYLTVAGENSYHVDYQNRAQFGAELWVYNALALRGGYKWNYTDRFSAGAGLKHRFGGKDLRVDFSYSDYGEFLNAPMRFTLSGSF